MAPDCLAQAAEHRLFSLCAQRSFTPLMWLPALRQRVGNPLGAQAGMPMFRLAATGSKGFSDGIF
ncbi:MAG: hypothetical protein DMF19_10040 [Verrucomicrobia bacterium]|nr:MAG: hypothetical protein DMF19_10040 [Verrucomicrobiota bacterium]